MVPRIWSGSVVALGEREAGGVSGPGAGSAASGRRAGGSEVADEGDDRVVSGVAAAVRSDADLDVRGGGRRAGAAGEGVEDKDGAFAGRDEQGLEAGGEAPGGIGAVLPPAVGAAGVDVAAVDHEQGRSRRVEGDGFGRASGHGPDSEAAA